MNIFSENPQRNDHEEINLHIVCNRKFFVQNFFK